MTSPETKPEQIDELRDAVRRLRAAIGERFLGQGEVSELLLYSLLAGGHALLEGAPGLGKTTLVQCLASAVALDFARVQFTPDLMPPDILGSRVLELADGGARGFRFEPGPIFTHVLLADEINRATPRTQSALLEAMQERQVTIFGETRALEEPFLVIATQNPIEMEGTYPLPEAQLDRFMFKVELALPDPAGLEAILDATTCAPPPPIEPVLKRERLLAMRALVREVPAPSAIVRLVAGLVHATHPESELAPERVRSLVRYGASPRGGQSILLAAKARALTKGRLFVNEDDVRALAAPALRHRLILGYEGEASGVSADELIADALAAAARVTKAG
jgi:MoxR-like ATPase